MKTLFFSFLLLIIFHASKGQYGEISGIIKDTTLNSGLEYAAIAVENQMYYFTTITNDHGVYYVNPVPPGKYKLTVSYMDKIFVRENIHVFEDKITEVNFEVSSAVDIGPIVIVPEPEDPLIKRFEPDVFMIDQNQLEQGASREIEEFVGNVPFVFVDDGQIRIKGARVQATKIIIDGMSIRGQDIDIPITSIRNIDVLTGAIPSKYGDAIGGFIIIETKGY